MTPLGTTRDRRLATLLLATCSSIAITVPGWAADGSHPARAHRTKPRAEAAPENVQVVGRVANAGGLMRVQTAPEATSTVTSEAIAKKMTVSSPLQLVATLPGVNFGMSDAYGLSIRNDISVRGLDESEMGWVVDGAPGLDQAYLLPYSESWADNENIGDLTLVAGTSRLQDPVQSAAGGELIETVRDPSDRAGGAISYSVGSYKAQRAFIRLDSGTLGRSGLKMFGSYSYTTADQFNLPGRSSRTHVDYKLTKDWAPSSKSSLFVSYNDWRNARSNSYTLSQWETANTLGDRYSQGNYASNFIPGTTTNYWRFYQYTRRNVLVSFNNDLQLTNRLTLKVTPYFHWTWSNSPGEYTGTAGSLYYGNQHVAVDPSGLATVNGRFTAISNLVQEEYATGVNSVLGFDVTPHNKLTVGYWYDNWQMSQLSGISPTGYSGVPTSLTGDHLLRGTAGQVIASSNYQMGSDINALSVTDTQKFLGDRLLLTLGFKQFMEHLSGTDRVPGSDYHFSSVISQPLPRVNVSFQINRNFQIYINGTTNTRPPVPSTTYPDIYSISTGVISQSANVSTRPEYSIGEEIGLRYHGLFNGDLVFFNTNLTNHQLTTQGFINGAGVVSSISAGGETLRGVAAEIATHSYRGFSFYANAQYLHGTTDNDFAIDGDLLPTAGKTAVRSPKLIASVGLVYEHGPLFGNVILKYTDSQYSTLMNDESMPAYKTVDVALGYHLPFHYGRVRPVVKLNLVNLTNVPYLGSIATVQPNARATRGIYGTRIAAATPGYWLSAPFTAMLTVSTDF